MVQHVAIVVVAAVHLRAARRLAEITTTPVVGSSHVVVVVTAPRRHAQSHALFESVLGVVVFAGLFALDLQTGAAAAVVTGNHFFAANVGHDIIMILVLPKPPTAAVVGRKLVRDTIRRDTAVQNGTHLVVRHARGFVLALGKAALGAAARRVAHCLTGLGARPGLDVGGAAGNGQVRGWWWGDGGVGRRGS